MRGAFKYFLGPRGDRAIYWYGDLSCGGQKWFAQSIDHSTIDIGGYIQDIRDVSMTIIDPGSY